MTIEIEKCPKCGKSMKIESHDLFVVPNRIQQLKLIITWICEVEFPTGHTYKETKEYLV